MKDDFGDNESRYLFLRDFNENKLYEVINNDFTLRPIAKSGNYQTLSNDIIDTKKENVIRRENNLYPLAQKSIDARRLIGVAKPDDYRTEFQRDKDRIIHSRSYRRLVDKAQVYNTEKGDHYRTRLTHTLEVNQIARSIARYLNLNEDLTEAIAIGHDLGHTPFGHQGERQLNKILSGKVNLSEEHKSCDLGKFKHNYQGIKVLTYLEEKYTDYYGLDVTYQVLEGVLKHTKIKICGQKEKNVLTAMKNA